MRIEAPIQKDTYKHFLKKKKGVPPWVAGGNLFLTPTPPEVLNGYHLPPLLQKKRWVKRGRVDLAGEKINKINKQTIKKSQLLAIFKVYWILVANLLSPCLRKMFKLNHKSVVTCYGLGQPSPCFTEL